VLFLHLLAGVLAPGAAGALAGRGVRALLAGLRRGVVVVPGPCEVALGCGWAAIGTGTVVGALPVPWVPALAGLAALAVAATATDVLAGRLPDRLTLPALPVALALLAPLGPVAVAQALGGAALLGGAHVVVHLAAPSALGGGDVKLAAVLGAPLGAASLGAVVLLPVLAAGVLLAAATVCRRRRVPFGPALLAAAAVELAVIV
jgi:leader peptidase (prepilin peptidase)/N-methyltransferase